MPVLFLILAAVTVLAVVGRKPKDVPSVRTPADDVILTISGTVTGHGPAEGRPGCVLTLTNGVTTGRYYVHAAPSDAERLYPAGRTAVLRAYQGTTPVDGIYETL